MPFYFTKNRRTFEPGGFRDTKSLPPMTAEAIHEPWSIFLKTILYQFLLI
jgi:hypothetical protein